MLLMLFKCYRPANCHSRKNSDKWVKTLYLSIIKEIITLFPRSHRSRNLPFIFVRERPCLTVIVSRRCKYTPARNLPPEPTPAPFPSIKPLPTFSTMPTTGRDCLPYKSSAIHQDHEPDHRCLREADRGFRRRRGGPGHL